MNAVLTSSDKVLNRFAIFRSERTTLTMEIAGILLLIFYFFIKESDLQFWLIWGVFAFVGASIVYDILWKNLQKKYIVQKCPRTSCDKILKIKKSDDNNADIQCSKCKIVFKKWNRNIHVID